MMAWFVRRFVEALFCLVIFQGSSILFAKDESEKVIDFPTHLSAPTKPGWRELFPDLAKRYNVLPLPKVKTEKPDVAVPSTWKALGPFERLTRAINVCKELGRIPGCREDDSEVQRIGRWVVAKFGGQEGFYKANETELREIEDVRIQIGDPILIADLEAREERAGLSEEEAEKLERLYWFREKLKAVNHYIRRKGWWPLPEDGHFPRRMYHWIDTPPAGKTKKLFWKLDDDVKTLLIQNGFKTEKGKHSHPCIQTLERVSAPRFFSKQH